MSDAISKEMQDQNDRVSEGLHGLLNTVLVASTILLFAYLQIITSVTYDDMQEADLRSFYENNITSTNQLIYFSGPGIMVCLGIIMICISTTLVEMVLRVAQMGFSY